MTNPLLKFDGLPDFKNIDASHVVPAVETILEDSREALQQVESCDTRDWEHIVKPLDELSRKLGCVWGPVNHLLYTRSDEKLRQAHQKVQGEIVNFSLEYSQSKKLYEAYKHIAETQKDQLSPSQKRILETNIRDAELSGIALSGQDKERFNDISRELTKLSTTFSNNVLDATKSFELVLENKEDIDGLPSSFLAFASQSYAQANPDNKQVTPEQGPWRVTLDIPSYVPFMQHATNRSLRKKLNKEFSTRASKGTFDNSPLISKILKLRKEKAQLLGFDSFASLSVTRKMASKVASVDKLLEELRSASFNAAQDELSELKQFAKNCGYKEELELWDVSFWTERMREKKFNFTDEDLKPYFPLPNVLKGLFSLVEQIFDIKVTEADGEASVWNDDVRFFHINDQGGERIASFFLDPYNRPENKRGGAWMDSCVDRGSFTSGHKTPVAYLVCNSTPPVGETPSLMSFREVETLFHEFGHGLQHMLTKIDEPQVSGINGVEWDAVELPSQFMENWCYHKKTLLGLAKHYQTGEVLPDELFEKLSAARNYMAANQMLRQIRFAMTDIELHHRYEPGDDPQPVFDIAYAISKTTSVIEPSPDDRMLCSFSHIFAGGYAAGYYSYKWAEVLSADAFAAFEEAGLDDAKNVTRIGHKFRDTVLALGGSQHPMEVFKEFRGREPSTEALLIHAGLVNS